MSTFHYIKFYLENTNWHSAFTLSFVFVVSISAIKKPFQNVTYKLLSTMAGLDCTRVPYMQKKEVKSMHITFFFSGIKNVNVCISAFLLFTCRYTGLIDSQSTPLIFRHHVDQAKHTRVVYTCIYVL